jgi:hypothetical protein
MIAAWTMGRTENQQDEEESGIQSTVSGIFPPEIPRRTIVINRMLLYITGPDPVARGNPAAPGNGGFKQ